MTPGTQPLLIYIAGPYRGPNAWEIDKNIHAARVWGVVVAKCGAYPMIPHSNTAHFDGVADAALWLAGTLEMMRRCDGALFIPGWRQSSGARAENEEAWRLGIPTLDGDEWGGRGGSAVSNDVRYWLSKLTRRGGA